MSAQESLFEKGMANTPARHLSRSGDPMTSKLAAARIAYRTGTTKARLLEVYRSAGPTGLTDAAAADAAGLDPWQASKRCSDLRNDGAIAPITTVQGRHGTEVRVCAIVEENT